MDLAQTTLNGEEPSSLVLDKGGKFLSYFTVEGNAFSYDDNPGDKLNGKLTKAADSASVSFNIVKNTN
jgi:hypothetical protein